jgi:hypothetical protein
MLRSLLLALALPATALAHHEAIVGPQSSPVLSGPGFVSLQAYTRRFGTPATQQSTGLVSGGVSPFSFPLSFSLIVPVTYVAEPDGARLGLQNLILGVQYRVDFDGLIHAWAKEGNFAMVMGAVEPPTGSLEHRPFDGPFNVMGAGLLSLERGAFSGSLYAFGRANGRSSAGETMGDTVFFGGGLAWTPLEREDGTSFSLQLGASYELYAHDLVDGVADASSGGRAFMLHPTVVVCPAHRLLVFFVLSVPAYDTRPSEAAERFRAGAGLVVSFG